MSTSLVIPGERPLVELFRRKYLQMEDPHEIEFPPKDLIKSAAAQAWLVENMFDRHHLEHLPTARYTFRIMKKLFSILEAAIEDPEEDEILDELAVCFCEVLGQATQDEMDSVQEKCPVTYTAPSLAKDAPTITLMETPFLLASGGDTGNRTWAAALYLGTYLFSAGRHFIENKTVIELGAGLGFVSILCGKHLRAKHVLMTDGSDAVIRLAQDNVNLNGVDQVVGSTVLQWGSPGIDDVLQPGCQPMQFDLVLGADILYEPEDFPALMSTLKDLFSRSIHIQFLMSTVVRTESTLESFLDACSSNCFRVERLAVPILPENEQIGFFHSTFDPIYVYLITSPQGKTP